MKNKTLRYTSLSGLTLLTALTLVACGGKTDKNTSSSNQKKTTKVILILYSFLNWLESKDISPSLLLIDVLSYGKTGYLCRLQIDR